MKAEYFWDICDDDSPFGNDTGADTLEFYREHLESEDDDDEQFLADLLEEWDVDRRTAESVPDGKLKQALEREHFHILTYDDVVVALAFAQLVFRGRRRRGWLKSQSGPSSGRPCPRSSRFAAGRIPASATTGAPK